MKISARIAVTMVVAMIVSSLWSSVVDAANVQVSGSVTNQSGFGIASVTVAVWVEQHHREHDHRHEWALHRLGAERDVHDSSNTARWR